MPKIKFFMQTQIHYVSNQGGGGNPPYLGDISREQPLIVKDYPPIGPIWNVTQALYMLIQSRCEML